MIGFDIFQFTKAIQKKILHVYNQFILHSIIFKILLILYHF